MININGANFHLHGQAGMQYVVENQSVFSVWYRRPITPKNFVINTGIQDCSKTGKASSQTDGYAGKLWINDLMPHGTAGAFTTLLAKEFQIRIAANGICP